MKDSVVETATPATTSAAPSIQEGLDMQRRNFFPFPVLWFSLVALEISVLADMRIAEADIWFHLRNARELLTRHSFLRADSYTFTTAGAPLLNFEWLSELPYYFAFQAWGLRGLLAVYLVVLWLVFAAVYYLAVRRGANFGDAALVTMAGVVLGCYSFGPRMLHFGWLCLVLVLLVLERFQRTGKGLWVLPPLFALWINLHGSWVFGFGVMGIYVISGLVEGQWNNVEAKRWTPDQLRKLLLVFAASAVALLANPYGYKLVWYPFELLSRQQAVRDNMIEWQSVDFHSGWGKLAMFMILALLGAAWFSRKTWKLSDILLATFAVWAALNHLRFLLFAAILLVPILAPRLRLLPPYDATKDKPWLNLAITAAIAAIIVGSYPSAAQLQDRIDSVFPRDALSFMQQKQITGRLFNSYDFGGYIEFYAPGIKTFADGRTDIFAYNGVLDDYLKINTIERPLELLDKYKIDYVLFPVDKHLSYLLDHSAGWQTIYEDKTVKLYQRAF
jgi:predicted secreted protein